MNQSSKTSSNSSSSISTPLCCSFTSASSRSRACPRLVQPTVTSQCPLLDSTGTGGEKVSFLFVYLFDKTLDFIEYFYKCVNAHQQMEFVFNQLLSFTILIPEDDLPYWWIFKIKSMSRDQYIDKKRFEPAD